HTVFFFAGRGFSLLRSSSTLRHVHLRSQDLSRVDILALFRAGNDCLKTLTFDRCFSSKSVLAQLARSAADACRLLHLPVQLYMYPISDEFRKTCVCGRCDKNCLWPKVV